MKRSRTTSDHFRGLFFSVSFSALLSVLSTLTVLGAAGAAGAEETKSRVRPLPEAEWSPETRQLLQGTRERVARLEGEAAAKTSGTPETLNILRTMAHHPKLLGPFLNFASALAMQGELSRRDSELLALRAAWNCQSDFEWGHHVVYARAAGIEQAEIDRIPLGPSAPGWSAADANLLRAADQLHAHQQIDDRVWKELAARYREAQLVEISFVVGQYTMLSMLANSTGVELEAELDPLPPIAASAAH